MNEFNLTAILGSISQVPTPLLSHSQYLCVLIHTYIYNLNCTTLGEVTHLPLPNKLYITSLSVKLLSLFINMHGWNLLTCISTLFDFFTNFIVLNVYYIHTYRYYIVNLSNNVHSFIRSTWPNHIGLIGSPITQLTPSGKTFCGVQWFIY